jgi:hypothetical protein
MRWNLSVTLIGISYMSKDDEYFFMYFLAIYTSFENCLFNSFAHLIGLFVLFGVIFFFVFRVLCLLDRLSTTRATVLALGVQYF